MVFEEGQASAHGKVRAAAPHERVSQTTSALARVAFEHELGCRSGALYELGSVRLSAELDSGVHAPQLVQSWAAIIAGAVLSCAIFYMLFMWTLHQQQREESRRCRCCCGGRDRSHEPLRGRTKNSMCATTKGWSAGHFGCSRLHPESAIGFELSLTQGNWRVTHSEQERREAAQTSGNASPNEGSACACSSSSRDLLPSRRRSRFLLCCQVL